MHKCSYRVEDVCNYIVYFSYFKVVCGILKFVVDNAFNGELITNEEVEMQLEIGSMSCLDKNVSQPSFQKYFTKDAWLAVLQVVRAVKKNPT